MAMVRGSEQSTEDAEVIGLAKRRLMRVFRLDEPTAHRALQKAAMDQREPLIALALRVLAASPEDLAAGRVIADLRAAVPQRPGRRSPPSQRPLSKQPSHKPPRRPRRTKE